MIFACIVILLVVQGLSFSSSPALRTEYPPSLVPDVKKESNATSYYGTEAPIAQSALPNLRTAATPTPSRTSLQSSESYRVAVLVPNMKNTLPPWFLAFAFSAQISAPLLDWYIFMDEPTYLHLPSNIRIIHLTEHEYYTRIALLDNGMSRKSTSLDAAATAVGKLIASYPYFLVELKPALGTMFQVVHYRLFYIIVVGLCSRIFSLGFC